MVKLPRDGIGFASGVVLKRARDDNGQLNGDPILDTSVSEVKLAKGGLLTGIMPTEHIDSQVDGIIMDKGHKKLITLNTN